MRKLDLRGSELRSHISKMQSLFLVLLFFCSVALSIQADIALAAYRILLKNGSSIIVESYKKIDNKVQFFLFGGMIEIDSSDVVEITEIPHRLFRGEVPGVEEVQTREEKDPSTLSPLLPSIPEINEEEIRIRLEELQKEKEVLKREAAQVMEEVEKLNRDIRREGRLLALRKKRELEKRREELERLVDDINKRIEELNREEEGLLRKLWRY